MLTQKKTGRELVILDKTELKTRITEWEQNIIKSFNFERIP